MDKVRIEAMGDGDIFRWNGQDVVAAESYQNGYVFVTNSEVWEKNGTYSHTGGAFEKIPPKTMVEYISNIETLESDLAYLKDEKKYQERQLRNPRMETNQLVIEERIRSI